MQNVSNGIRPSCIFLTGASGFLGKVVLEELIRRRDEYILDQIFVLLRPSKGLSAQQRFDRGIVASKCFENLPPTWVDHVVVVEGDLCQPNAGIADDFLPAICKEVTHIINCAACVSFDLSLVEAVKSNVLTAKNLICLAQACPNLASLVTTSTAYVAAHKAGMIAPKPATLPYLCNAEELYHRILAGKVDEKTILRESGYSNTYTLSKCLAEHMFLEAYVKSIIANLKIVRPSIISCSIQFPSPGWIDSKAAIAGFIALLGSGHLRVIDGRKDAILDVVAVDIVAADIMCEAGLVRDILPLAYPPRHLEPSVVADGVRNPIIHSVAGLERGLPVGLVAQRSTEYFKQLYASTGSQVSTHRDSSHHNKCFRTPKLTYLGPRNIRYYAHNLIEHQLPLGAANVYFNITGEKQSGLKTRSLRRVVHKVNEVFPYYTRKTFEFEVAANRKASWFGRSDSQDMVPSGKEVGRIWQTEREAYLDIIIEGVRRHLLMV
jgi:alcohol-forming fatty acyl-CoA reductase